MRLRVLILIGLSNMLWTITVGCSNRTQTSARSTTASAGTHKARLASHEEIPSNTDAKQPGFVAVVVAGEAIEVASEFEGQIASIAVDVGLRVETGDTLITLETAELEQDVWVAQAELRSSRALREQARVEFETLQQRNERRQAARELYSTEEIESEAGEALKADAVYQAAIAAVEREEARVAQMRRRLYRSSIRAPIDGEVALLHLDAGSRVRPGQAILRLISAGDGIIRFAIPPAVVEGVDIGGRVELRIADSDLRLEGVVSQIAPNVDSPSQHVFCEAQITASPPWVRDGLVGRVFLNP